MKPRHIIAALSAFASPVLLRANTAYGIPYHNVTANHYPSGCLRTFVPPRINAPPTFSP